MELQIDVTRNLTYLNHANFSLLVFAFLVDEAG
jgi:hypothetical protein